jgi:NADPH2:quinone reductase
VPEPAADEIVIRIEAAPLNPSDIILLLGPADPSVVRAVGTAKKPRAVAPLPKEHIAGLQARLDVALPVGNEGAGIVIMAGSAVDYCLGAQWRRAPLRACKLSTGR